MRRALVAAALLFACAACQQDSPSPGGGSGSVEQEVDQIESTVDSVESELAGD
ncbi:hypothetical protein [Actinokineospora sp.]|uniref:hypothetical protein n=1 Tax=Actinokineospora sp. TaxID=1872133 RepID=UPI0040378D01